VVVPLAVDGIRREQVAGRSGERNGGALGREDAARDGGHLGCKMFTQTQIILFRVRLGYGVRPEYENK
jgi:hypothetical protein